MKEPQKIERIDDEAGGRKYGVDGRKLPSVTNILDVLSKPGLLPWAVSKERDAIFEATEDLWKQGKLAPGVFSSPEELFTAIKGVMGEVRAHAKAMDEAAAIGTSVHGEIERGLRAELGLPAFKRGPSTLSEDNKVIARRAFDSYKTWKVESRFTPRLIETTVYSLKYGYAGTLDVLGELLHQMENAVAVGDWKTARSVYITACMQISAYRQAVLEMELHDATVPLHGVIVRLPKYAIDPDFEVRFIPEAELRDVYFPQFLACLELWKGVQEYERRYPWRKKGKGIPL